jgi:hypothetical protein
MQSQPHRLWPFRLFAFELKTTLRLFKSRIFPAYPPSNPESFRLILAEVGSGLELSLCGLFEEPCRRQSAKVTPLFSIAHSTNQTQENDVSRVILAPAGLHQTTIRQEVRQET